MFIRYVLPVISVALIVFAIWHVSSSREKDTLAPPPIPPARSPYTTTVSGAGLIEPQTENIEIGTPVPGVVVEVLVEVGQRVAAGDPLFRLDDRQLQAELHVRQADLEAARADLARLESQPRPEELPPAEARIHEAEAQLANARDQSQRAQDLYARKVMPQEDLVRARQAERVALAQLERVQADYQMLRAGAWEPDKVIARAAVTRAESQVASAKTDLDRLTVRALVAGEVLQVSVRPGEFVGAPSSRSLIVLGNVRQLHVRVDIDEHDIPRFQPGAPARGMVKGHPELSFPMTFVRVEPYVIPKRSLTGDNRERVDTRVLQVIYAIEPPEGTTLYVGQQVDAYLETDVKEEGERGR